MCVDASGSLKGNEGPFGAWVTGDCVTNMGIEIWTRPPKDQQALLNTGVIFPAAKSWISVS